MDGAGLQNYFPLLLIFGLGVLFAGAFLLLARFFGPHKPTPNKLDIYECGIPIHSDARERLSVKFFLIAMIFLVFDVEAVFLFPWAILVKSYKSFDFLAPMLVFLGILALGLIYEYKRGALEWEK